VSFKRLLHLDDTFYEECWEQFFGGEGENSIKSEVQVFPLRIIHEVVRAMCVVFSEMAVL
jgi:hypothetical protein